MFTARLDVLDQSRRAGDARVVDEDVDTSPQVDDPLDPAFGVARVADVADDGVEPRIGLGGDADHGLVAVADAHPGTVGAEALGDRGSDP
jgi:hypothetical protein